MQSLVILVARLDLLTSQHYIRSLELVWWCSISTICRFWGFGLMLGGDYNPTFFDGRSSCVTVTSLINARFVDAGAWPLAWLSDYVGGCSGSLLWAVLGRASSLRVDSSGRPKLPGSGFRFNGLFLLRQAVSVESADASDQRFCLLGRFRLERSSCCLGFIFFRPLLVSIVFLPKTWKAW